MRKELNKELKHDKVKGNDDYSNGGISKISNKDLKLKITNMLVELKYNNIIILKYGCLETVFEDLGLNYTKNKSLWFKKSIELINNLDEEKLESSYIYNWIFN